MLIDSHAHLDNDKYGDHVTLVENFRAEGGKYLVDVGYDYESSLSALSRAERFEGVFFTAGYHPQEADKNNDIGLIAPLLNNEKCIAVGEIGLDYHYLPFDRRRQTDLFESQIMLAYENGLPIVIHSREASKDMLDVLKCNKNYLGNGLLMHCYSESREQAKNYCDLGAYFAFGGATTFKNAKKEDIIRSIPIDRLLAETDSPYMTPVPYRGQKNEPSFVKYVYAKLANILNIDEKSLEEQLYLNFFTLFQKARKNS